MDIVVHGTKGGRQIFTPKKIGGLLDINSDTSNASAVGREAYAIRFLEKSIIFSKYKIIRDVRGDKRLGFLGFSLFIPNNYKLTGTDIIILLNRVSEEYCRRYIPDSDNNLKDVRENWDFLDRISEEFKAKLCPVADDDIETLLSGTIDDAIIYYENDEKLQRYFDAPYQDEYKQYRQVLFIKEELKDRPESPLNALRHSDSNLTGKIDLENPKYKLLYNQTAKGGVRIDVKVNGITRSRKSKIRRKDELEISWSKLYCETVTKRGRWNEISNEFLDVNSSSETISVKEIMPLDKTKTITFDLRDQKGNPIMDAEITSQSDYGSKPIINNLATFRGQEIGQRWSISAKKGDNFFTGQKQIIPENESRVEIVLNERKKVKFQGELKAENDSKYFPDIKISIKEKNIERNANTEVEFIDDEINEQFKVIAIYSDNDKYLCGEKEFSPKDTKVGIPVLIELKQRTTQSTVPTYFIETGKLGSASAGYTYKKDGSDINVTVKTRGYYFTGFKLDKKKKSGYEGTLVAQYEKKQFFYQSRMFIASMIVVAFVIGVIVLAFFSSNGKKQPIQTPVITESEIKNYAHGIYINNDTLNSYRNQWNAQKPAVTNDSTDYKSWVHVSASIDTAIIKRKYINDFNFLGLNQLNYSHAQLKFKTEIGKIDSSKYDYIKKRFGNVSSWSLDQIADSINAYLYATKPAIENKEVVKTGKEEKEESLEEKRLLPPTNTSNQNNITKELQSGTVTKDELNKWRFVGMDKYKKSIDLYLDFWASIKTDMQKKDSEQLLKKINTDEYLKNSALQSFLKSVCSSSETFKKYNATPGKAACKTINELRNKIK